MRLLTISVLASAITCAAVCGGAQESSIAVSATSRAAVVGRLSEVLRREYVLSDEGEQMAILIARQLRGGAYDTLTDADRFAAALTRDLRSVYLDKHLGVLPPARYRDFERIVSGSHGADAHGVDAPVKVESRLMNRDGRTSVGFVRMTRFDGSDAGLAQIDTAMRRIVGAEAVIIDLRASPGGDADAVKALSSYFFAEPTHLVTSLGPRDATGKRDQMERWTAPNALSSSFAAVPLYLLIDGKTFSAAESFAFGLESLGRAQVIGAPTGGGGFMNAPFALAAGFGASISVGRTFDPRTGKGWQSTGVVPTVAVEPDHALNTALNIIADRASARAGLDARAQGVYSAVQRYTNAW